MSTGEAAAGVAPDGGWAPVRMASCRPPALGAAVVPRPRLVERLVAASPGDLVVLTAAAGYGKTITAGLWEQADPRPFAWVALEPLDDDPAHLVVHVAAALAHQGLVDPEDVQFLSSPGRSPVAELVPVLGEMLVGVETFVLVLDDVHVVQDPLAVDVLVALVDAMPANAVVALLSRTPPLRGTARRRLAGQVVEVRQADLALRTDEARAAFVCLGTEVDGDTLDALVERCEGWPGGMHLAALALRDRPVDAAASFSGRNRLVADYLVEEVLEGLEPSLVAFLEEASLLADFTAARLDAVLGRHDSGRCLDRLEASGCLFLVALDDDGERYRLHHLLQELLESRLRRRDPERWRTVHAVAADVLLADGDTDGAVRHAAAGGDAARAAALVQRDAVALALSGRAGVLARRIAMLDASTRRDDVNAATARAWWAIAEGDPMAVRSALSDVRAADTDRPLADGSASPASAVALMTAFVGDGGLEGVRRNASIAVDTGDCWSPLARAVRATALVQTGAHAEARADLLVAIEGLHPVAGIEAAALELLAWLHGRDGELASAIAYADGGHRILHRHQLQGVVAVAVAWSLDALTAARVGQRERAVEDAAVAERAVGRLAHEVPRTLVFNHQLLAEAHHLLGDGAEARRHLQEAVRVHRRHPLSPWFDLENARLAELLGRGPSGTSLSVTPLTAAERRLLPHLATHLSLPQIAVELHVSRNTVKTHCVSVYRKLGVSSRAGAVAEARRLGLIPA